MAERKFGDYSSRQDHIPDLKTPDIEVFENVYQGRTYDIFLEIPEFTAICPKTGLPDFGTIYITYRPDKFCLELKSLKEYFLFYRNVGIFHENVVNKVLEDLVKVAQPFYMKVRADYNVRGGIKTTVEREYVREV
ncbi:MAG: preQ(1) synthase [Leptospiraceae bacterium]|nr:preQ(1) synthase [Leptospiraceae bacterium]MDW8307459.1 preQ(1) synthase [Leptospiraceae bacterium]